MADTTSPLRLLLFQGSHADAERVIAELRRAGYEPSPRRVTTAKQLEAALARGDWNVVVADDGVRGVTAAEVVRLVRSRHGDLPVVLLTDGIGDEAVAEVMRAGASDVVSRQNLARLGVVVERALREAQERAATRLADEAERRRDERYHRIVEVAAEHLPLVTYVGRIAGRNASVYISPKIEDLLGYTPEEWRRDEGLFVSRIHADDRERVLAELERARREQQPFSCEYRLIARDGRVVWVDDRAVVVRGEEGEALYVQGYAVDITERKAAEQRAAAQNALTTIIAEAASLEEAAPRIMQAVCEGLGWEVGGIWLVDRDADVLRFVELWRLSTLEVPVLESYLRGAPLRRGLGLVGTVWDRGEPMWIADISTIAHHDLFPVAHIALNHGLRSAFGFPITVGDEVLGVLGFLGDQIREPDAHILDMTAVIGGQLGQFIERKQTEEQLRASEAQFRAVFEQAAIGMAVVETSGRVIASNRAFQRMLGYTSAELHELTFADLTYLEDVAANRALFDQLVAGLRDHYELEKRYVRKDGELLWGYLTVSVVRDADGRPQFAMGMVQDISERKRLEEQFRQAQKMEAVGRLAGGIAHDFNNLLLAIRGYAELALAEVADANVDGDLRENIQQIKQASERAASLTRQLLAFSRKQILQPRIVDLAELVEEMEGLLKQVTGEGIELVISIDPTVGNVRVDPGQLEQAIMNIAINARDAMPGGGRLTIETANVDFPSAEVREGATLGPGSFVLLRIADTGCGMDADTKRRAFEPFFTTKGTEEGTGLGLSTVYGFVKQSDGFVFIDSEPGRGAAFTIYLPRVSQPVADVVGDEGPMPATTGAETVLLAEDEELVRAMLREVLEKEGYLVLEARNGAEAVEIAERHPGPIHVLVSDLVMPVMGGREAAVRLAKLRPETAIIYMSGYTDEIAALDEIETGETFFHFLQKPFQPRALAGKVREILDGVALPR